MPPRDHPVILWYDDISARDVAIVGRKNASLGEMTGNLRAKGIRIPEGFAVTAEGYAAFARHNRLPSEIAPILGGLNPQEPQDLGERGQRIRDLVLRSTFPEPLKLGILENYRRLGQRTGGPAVSVAVRSSPAGDDSRDAGAPSPFDTHLNVAGEERLLEAVKMCYASLYADSALRDRVEAGEDEAPVALSVGIQRMARSDLACSGVMVTLDPESGFDKVVHISGSWGLGQQLLQGRVDPDHFLVFKETLADPTKRPILERRLGNKDEMVVFDAQGGVKRVAAPREKREGLILSEEEVLRLARWGVAIEAHFGAPQEIEWAKDGETGQLYIVQARPEKVHSTKRDSSLETYVLQEEGEVLLTGRSLGPKIGAGQVRVIDGPQEMYHFHQGEVLVTDRTDPDWEPIMKMASAIVTNRGGRASHAAIVSRELGIPCVVGTQRATQVLRTGQEVTVDCSRGLGRILRGRVPFRIDRLEIGALPKTRTKIMINAGMPEQAFLQARLPCDGVGLCRVEFIISSKIGIHPLALVEFEQLRERAQSDPEVAPVVNLIQELTWGYANKGDYYVDHMAQGIGRIAAAFWPNDVIVRLADFKSNEYANLIGGRLYEPRENNPMIGWRGACRCYDPKFKPAFRLECQAFRKVRGEFGLTNVKVMVPFCRTPEEGRKVVATMAEFGLRQGEDGLEIYVMAEIPANIVLADEFADIFDGFSIGSNDLTQLTLGLDRDSELVAHLYDERNEAVKRLLAQVIAVARRRGRKIGICGQAPSDFPEMAEFLVEAGIDAMSLNPDTLVRTRILVAEKERALAAGDSGAPPPLSPLTEEPLRHLRE